mmetsp:Transcript_1527/g.6113  ORF Transcript_1527/g.6113 Transcript_1527/m.6113 type:complete len:251 (-) Transcript_1527:2748-3500(-)
MRSKRSLARCISSSNALLLPRAIGFTGEAFVDVGRKAVRDADCDAGSLPSSTATRGWRLPRALASSCFSFRATFSARDAAVFALRTASFAAVFVCSTTACAPCNAVQVSFSRFSKRLFSVCKTTRRSRSPAVVSLSLDSKATTLDVLTDDFSWRASSCARSSSCRVSIFRMMISFSSARSMASKISASSFSLRLSVDAFISVMVILYSSADAFAFAETFSRSEQVSTRSFSIASFCFRIAALSAFASSTC